MSAADATATAVNPPMRTHSAVGDTVDQSAMEIPRPMRPIMSAIAERTGGPLNTASANSPPTPSSAARTSVR